jgi:import inner membrane translocase subunit TIM44
LLTNCSALSPRLQGSGPSTSGSQQQQGEQQQQAGGFYGAFKAGYENVKGKAAGAAGGGDTSRRLMQTLAQDLREVLLPAQDITSITKAYKGPVWTDTYDGPTSLVLTKQEPTGFQKAWEGVQEKVRPAAYRSRDGKRLRRLAATTRWLHRQGRV